jgi:hypothetical protein
MEKLVWKKLVWRTRRALTGDASFGGRRARRPQGPPAPPVDGGHGKVLPIGSDASLLSLKIGLDNGGHFRDQRLRLQLGSSLLELDQVKPRGPAKT